MDLINLEWLMLALGSTGDGPGYLSCHHQLDEVLQWRHCCLLITVAGPGVLCVSSNWCLLFISQGSALTHGNQCQKLDFGRFSNQGIQIIYHSERVIKCTTVRVSIARMQTIFITSKDVNLGTLWRGYYILMQNANCFASRLWLDRPTKRPGWEGQPIRLAH